MSIGKRVAGLEKTLSPEIERQISFAFENFSDEELKFFAEFNKQLATPEEVERCKLLSGKIKPTPLHPGPFWIDD